MQIVETERQQYESFKAKNDDPYGAGVVRFMESWAAAMEKEIAEGAKLEDIAERTSHAADTEGITGFMYGCAVGALGHYWIHGDALRRWHNGQHGVTEEQAKGGTVNPAILTIG